MAAPLAASMTIVIVLLIISTIPGINYEIVKSRRTKRQTATLYQIELLMVIHSSIYQRYCAISYLNYSDSLNAHIAL